jgi:hypothetical protein
MKKSDRSETFNGPEKAINAQTASSSKAVTNSCMSLTGEGGASGLITAR